LPVLLDHGGHAGHLVRLLSGRMTAANIVEIYVKSPQPA
jgi:hypothetical protein